MNLGWLFNGSGQPASPGRRAFAEGCVDAAPVCLSFMFLFFSIGAASNASGFSIWQALLMTASVHAAPLQVFITQHGTSLTLVPLAMTALIVNFRFVIMSSVLNQQFRDVPLWKLLFSTQLLSVSTFTLATAKQGRTTDIYHYYLGCGVSTLAAAMLATGLGHLVSTEQDGYLNSVILMILPLHFTALAALAWPKLRPLLITGLGFVATPLFGAWLGAYQIFVTPFVFGAVFLLVDRYQARRVA